MPRQRTLTGRTERTRNREAQYLRRENVNTSNDTNRRNRRNNDDNLVTVLMDNFKCALIDVPINFISHDCGPMSLRCMHCNAVHFEGEITGRNRNSFTICCHKGKVALPALTNNSFFQALYENLSSNDLHQKRLSQNYFNNIRKFNSAFAIVSSEAKIAETTMAGVYHFKIHDIFYHRAGPMTATYGRPPFYAQLYFYDVDTATNYRMRERSNTACSVDLMRNISNVLQRCNSFVRSFIQMKDFCDRNEGREVYMAVKVNRVLDIRRYNDAIATDVAVIFSTVDGEPPFERNIVAFSKINGTVKNISVLDSSLDRRLLMYLFTIL